MGGSLGAVAVVSRGSGRRARAQSALGAPLCRAGRGPGLRGDGARAVAEASGSHLPAAAVANGLWWVILVYASAYVVTSEEPLGLNHL